MVATVAMVAAARAVVGVVGVAGATVQIGSRNLSGRASLSG